MTNLEKYNNAFKEVFAVEDGVFNDEFSKDTVEQWDSVHQLNIISILEETFDIMLDPEDIMEFTSYQSGKKIIERFNILL